MRLDIELVSFIALFSNLFETTEHKNHSMMIVKVVTAARVWNFAVLPDGSPALTEEVIRPHIVKRFIVDIKTTKQVQAIVSRRESHPRSRSLAGHVL